MKHIKEVIQEWLMTSSVVPDTIRNRIRDDVQTDTLRKSLASSARLAELLRQFLSTLPDEGDVRSSMRFMVVLMLKRADGVEVEDYEGGPRLSFSKDECQLAAQRLLSEHVMSMISTMSPDNEQG